MQSHEGEPELSRAPLRTPRNLFEGVAFGLQLDQDHYALRRPNRPVSDEAHYGPKTLTGIVLPNEPDFEAWIPNDYSDETYLITLGYSILRNNRAFLMGEFGEARVDYGEFPGLVKGLLDLSDKEAMGLLGGDTSIGKNDSRPKLETAFLTARFLVDALEPVHGEDFGKVIRTDSDLFHHRSMLSELATNPRFVVGRVYEDMHWGKTS